MELVDPDTCAVVAHLRQAQVISGLTQAGFACAIGTSGSRLSTYLAGKVRPSAQLFVRAQRLARALHGAAAQGLMPAPGTAAAVRDQLHAGNAAWAWRMLLQGRDHLRLMLARPDDSLLGAWEAAPATTGSPEFDALLAALTRHEFVAAHRPAPDWARTEPLERPWVVEHPFLTPERVMAQTPQWLRELNIFVPERDLLTA